MTEPRAAGTVLVTGVGRRPGIAATLADRLRHNGWTVVTTGWQGLLDSVRQGCFAWRQTAVLKNLARPERLELPTF